MHGDWGKAWELNPTGFVLVFTVLKRTCMLWFTAKEWSGLLGHWMLDTAILISFFGLAFLRYFGVL